MSFKKKLLYRKVNTKARGVHHNFGGDFKNSRNKKRDSLEKKGSMRGKKQRGLDYTPLFKFLLSKVGSEWDKIFSEAKSRLDKTDPIYWLVSLQEEGKKRDYVRVGESSYFSTMYVDEDGILQLTKKPNPQDIVPTCKCCTWTLNGKPIR